MVKEVGEKSKEKKMEEEGERRGGRWEERLTFSEDLIPKSSLSELFHNLSIVSVNLLN